MSGFYKFVKLIGGFIFRTFYKIKYVGTENLPKNSGYVICSNHTSMTDVPFIAIGCNRQIFFMAKQELFKGKFLNWFFKKLGAFPVERGTGGKEAIKEAISLIENGNVMGIFPEGKRNFEGAPKKAKSGISVIVASTNAMVVPVSVYHEGKIKLFGKVTVRYGKPILPEEIGLKDNSRSELKRISGLIMEKISEQWELGY